MDRVLLSLLISLVAYSSAVADVVVSKGDTNHLWLPDGEGPWLRFSLAYLNPNGGGINPTTAIGTWFDGAGLYDRPTIPTCRDSWIARPTELRTGWLPVSAISMDKASTYRFGKAGYG
jgi:hypothetical protein